MCAIKLVLCLVNRFQLNLAKVPNVINLSALSITPCRGQHLKQVNAVEGRIGRHIIGRVSTASFSWNLECLSFRLKV